MVCLPLFIFLFPGHPELVPVIHAVVYAANSGNLVPLKRLDKGLLKMAVCIPDSDGRTLFHYAAATGKTHVSKYFMEQVKVDDVNMKDARGQTPLHYAILGHYYHTAAYLLENGADPNAANENGETSLHYAACTGIKRILRLLISKGANVDAISNHGTPLHNAAAHGKKDSVRILLENHADPNVIFHDHVPPLVMAIHANSIECVELLLQAGADPNIRKHGVTPLESAASEGLTEIIKCLLNAGADPNVTSFYGLTPIEIAALQCYYQGVVILFPVTSRIAAIPDWSTVGIMKYIHSEEATQQMNRKLKENFLTLKSKGEDAFKRKDYLGAICWYTEAINADPSDATVLSNRSLCWARMNEGSRALSDAEACVALRPDWPKAYYREGVAYRLLKDFVKSAYSFNRALELDPKNEELQKAFWEAVGFVIR
nr:ankyrin-1-like isoform X1 [Quercus suber]